MFRHLDILKIYDLIDINTCIFMYNVFKSSYHYNASLQCCQVRNIKQFLCYVCKNTKILFSVKIKGVSLWNSLHNYVILSSS